MKKVFLLILLCLTLSSVTLAQQEIPTQIDGAAVYVPFPVAITLDGDLSDWADIPAVTVERGPMTSDNPAENGSFTFAVAADPDYFYIYMTMPDQNIITGQHESEYWNEDSLEFYLNFAPQERYSSTYSENVVQININAGNIGNTDPTDLVISGMGIRPGLVEALVFATDDGWGFEGRVLLGDLVPEHGLEIGFQAQANGASQQDRDVKLIWSLADESDNSWQNPSLFGSALFFELGQTDIPLPAERSTFEDSDTEETEPTAEPMIAVNQVGYFVNGSKYAMRSVETPDASPWRLLDMMTGGMVAQGMTSEGAFDAASGDVVQVADFSDFTTPGSYQIDIGGVLSPAFEINDSIYDSLKIDAVRYFYLNRSGIALEETFAGEWARPAGHLTDNQVTCFAGKDDFGKQWDGCDYFLDGSKGWYDAGDYGKYVVNGGISVWTLMNLYEHFPGAFGDYSLNIPESGNTIPDILDETRWEMEFMLGLQVPDGQPLAGMVHHKLHDRSWSGVPSMVPTEYDNDPENLNPNAGRYVFMPTTAATLNLAATAAQCARLWQEYDPEFAQRCQAAAEKAWTAAQANPNVLTDNVPGSGGGGYGDSVVQDEFFWAAAELYITTGEAEYLDYLQQSPYYESDDTIALFWGNTAGLGTISLAKLAPDADLQARMQAQIIAAGDHYLEVLDKEGYRIPMAANAYYWGSNANLLNNGLILALAYDFSGDTRYLDGAVDSMDYMLGRNALMRSFVSGYGALSMEHPHHRFWGNQPARGFPPPPPGALAGGPNGEPSDPDALNALDLASLGPAKRYIDVIGSYSTNEVAINWNAPLAWLSTYLSQTLGAE